MRNRWPSRAAFAVAATLLLIACGSGTEGTSSGDDGEWRGTITTEGTVTTVVNESGSVWGGTATLVEELSIGVERGDEAYMLGPVRELAVTEERILLLDQSLGAVRVYDREGHHLMDVGSAGEGPGQFEYPEDLAVGPDAKIYVRAGIQGRIVVFERDGTPARTIRLDGGTMTSQRMVVTPEGVLLNPQHLRQTAPDGTPRRPMVAMPHLPDGSTGEPRLPPEFDLEPVRITLTMDGGMRVSWAVPFAPSTDWAIAPSGAIVAGAGNEYRFEVHRPDGSVLEVARAWKPIAVQPGEAEEARESRLTAIRRRNPGWTWNGPEIPSTKPAFSRLVPDRDGRVWVIRPGEGIRDPDCGTGAGSEEPGDCWHQETIVDVFGEDGRYLGGVDVPEDVRLNQSFSAVDDEFTAVTQDEAGTIRVKRYRLVLPEEDRS